MDASLLSATTNRSCNPFEINYAHLHINRYRLAFLTKTKSVAATNGSASYANLLSIPLTAWTLIQFGIGVGSAFDGGANIGCISYLWTCIDNALARPFLPPRFPYITSSPHGFLLHEHRYIICILSTWPLDQLLLLHSMDCVLHCK